MIVVDTSAIAAIVFEEPEAATFAQILREMPRPKLSTGSLVETFIVVAGRTGRDNGAKVLELLDGAGVDLVPVDRRQAVIAGQAFARFGKGRHMAALNYGDCFAYALARSLDLPLLFKGGDFRHTDIRPVI